MYARGTLVNLGLVALSAGYAHAGPDILVSQIQGANNYGVVGDVQAFSFGDVTCNIGDAPFTYVANTSQHPVFATTLYRLRDGRFEQIGVGFAGHASFPLQTNACDLGCNPGAPGMLGNGCSDTLSATTAGSQAGLGPRIEINASTGEFPYPFTTFNQSGNAVYKRMKVRLDDITHDGALYFVETQYISSEEGADAARNNNASYRAISFLLTPAPNTPQLMGVTAAGQAAIYAWRAADPGVMITETQIPGDGVVQVGSRATDLGDGAWRYDYAVHNQNSDRGVSSVSIPLGFNRGVSDQSFHDIEYLDEVDGAIDGTDWSVADLNGFAIWTTGARFDENPLANAIRWGTTYSFSMVSIHPPTTKVMELGMFRDEGLGSVVVSVTAPMSGECRADMNADGALDFYDLATFIDAILGGNLNADFTGDGHNDFFDVSAFLSEYAAGCP